MAHDHPFAPYPHDPHQIQERLDGARRQARLLREEASAAWLAAFALKQAAKGTPSPERRAAYEQQGQELQARHQAALHSASLCEETVAELQRQLSAVVDANLGCWCEESLFDHEASGDEMGRAA